MSNQLGRTEMIKLLHELDEELKIPLEIEICGASCAILNHGLDRTSTDIDVMRSSISLEDARLLSSIRGVAVRHGSEELWINDRAKKVFDYLPKNFKADTELVRGEYFKTLAPRVISKADFVITKLAHHSHIRQWDILDIKKLSLSDDDVQNVYKKLDLIGESQQYNALCIEASFKAIRNDFVKTIHGDNFLKADEISEYQLERFGFKATSEEKGCWQEEIDSLVAMPGSIVAKVDFNASAMLKNGDTGVAKKDREYREIRSKEVDYGLDF